MREIIIHMAGWMDAAHWNELFEKYKGDADKEMELIELAEDMDAEYDFGGITGQSDDDDESESYVDYVKTNLYGKNYKQKEKRDKAIKKIMNK
jgi:hypothetical protein